MRIQQVTVAISVLLCGCLQKSGENPAPAAPTFQANATANPVPIEQQPGGKVELQILDFDGIERLIASHRGHVVVMDVWSTSCAPCVKEFPKLVGLHTKHGPERLACISLSLDYEGIDTPQKQEPRVRKFLELQRATFENVLSSDESDVLRRKLKIASPPVVFVYDRSGLLRKRFDNQKATSEADAFTYEQIGELVAQLLDEEPAARQDDDDVPSDQ